ncbi:MAG: host specificity protein J [Ramlibacter sp.]
MTQDTIRGAKGKGGGRAPVEEQDSLRSTQYAEILDLVSEGEVQGLVNGLKSVYLDKVPIENPDGSRNFEGVEFAWTNGTQGQAALPGFPSIQNEVAVGLIVAPDTPVVRSITNGAVDTVRVTVGIPQLTFQNPENGDLVGTEVEFAIDVQSNGGGFVEKYKTKITGKTVSRYQRAVRLALSGPPPWDVRVRRVSPPASGSNQQNAIWFDSYTEIQSLKLRYPNSVVHGLRISAQQFSRVPQRAYDMLGIRVQVPVNYDPYGRYYYSTWNGTFKTSWTNNPAWILYDLITNARYGMGDYVDPAFHDKWKLYEIAQYCDELVPDGRGGQEPRFTCNLVLANRVEAFRALQDLAAVFRGMIFWAASAVQFSQDAPADAQMQFAPANVVDGVFTYSSTSLKQRHSVALVYWNNPADFYSRVPELSVDDELVSRIGLRELELSPLGVTSRGQAARIGRWALYSEQSESETVAFSTGLEGGGVRLGDVFQIADPSESGERIGGRVASGTASAVTLDAPVALEPGLTYLLTLMVPDPSGQGTYLTEQRAVTNAAGTASVINVSPPFSEAPPAQTIWTLASDALYPTTWRCISIRPNGKTYDVVGVAHNPEKYLAVEQGLVLERRPTSRLGAVSPAPTDLTFAETVYDDRGAYRSRLTIAWSPTRGNGSNQRFRVTWSWEHGPLESRDTTDQTLDLDGLAPGLVEVTVRAVNAVGTLSPPLRGSFNILGRSTAAPFDVFNVSAATDGTRVLTFGYTTSPVPKDWRGAEVRYVAGTVGSPDWDTMTPLHAAGTWFSVSPVNIGEPAGAGTFTFAARSRDAVGLSAAALCTVTLPATGRIFSLDLTPAPTPTGFGVVASLNNVWVTHDTPTYAQGHGHKETVLYGYQYPGGPLPVFNQAVEVMRFTGNTGIFPVAPGDTWRFWIKWVSQDGGLSAVPAGGTNGLQVTAGQLGGQNLAPLSVLAANLALAAVDLGSPTVTGTITDPVRFGAAAIGYTVTQYLLATSGVMGNLLVDNAQIVSLHANKLFAGTVTTDKLVVGAATAAANGQAIGAVNPGFAGISSGFLGFTPAVSLTSTGAPVSVDVTGTIDAIAENAAIAYWQYTMYLVVDGVRQSTIWANGYMPAFAGGGYPRRGFQPAAIVFRHQPSAGLHNYAVDVYIEARDATGAAVSFGAYGQVGWYGHGVVMENKV